MNHRAIADPAVGVGRGRVEEALDLGEAQDLRELAPEARPLDEPGGVGVDRAFLDEEPEKAPQARELPRARARAEAALDVVDEEARDFFGGDVARGGPVGQVRREAPEIARVRVERVLGQPALDAQVIEIGVDPAVQVQARPS
jgi:hypothetical protein